MAPEPNPEFINLFAAFYEMFFQNTAQAVGLLADIQEKFKTEYDSVREFSKDPQAIQGLVDKLSPEKRSVLLNILFQAGIFGKQLGNLFDSNVEDKKKLATELKAFAKELSGEMKGMKK
jgi:hypothetical protein